MHARRRGIYAEDGVASEYVEMVALCLYGYKDGSPAATRVSDLLVLTCCFGILHSVKPHLAYQPWPRLRTASDPQIAHVLVLTACNIYLDDRKDGA